jgi:tRNA (cmo5U34)-methyltransferase
LNESQSGNDWSSVQHALAYLNLVDHLPHRTEGEAVLLEHIPNEAKQILDLGTGDGQLIDC